MIICIYYYMYLLFYEFMIKYRYDNMPL